MQIQPVANQPNFNGKVIFEKGSACLTTRPSESLLKKYKEIAKLVSEKPYDIFISQNPNDKNFIDIAANKTFGEAKKIKEYTVKVQLSILPASIVDAAKDAMDMYEEYLLKRTSKIRSNK